MSQSLFGGLGHTPFALYDRVPVPEKSTPYTGLLESACGVPTLSRSFFCPKNVAVVQGLIRDAASALASAPVAPPGIGGTERSMHCVYVRYARTSTGSVEQQVAALNAMTVKYAAPRAANDALSHLLYLRDASQLAVPPRNPVATTKRGENTLEFKSFF